MIYDYIIIGSGSAGGTMSYFLSKTEDKVLLIEAGNTYTVNTFPKNEMNYNAQLFWNGAMDLNTDASLIFLRGKCLGGGSIVNQALMDRFDEYALKDWRDKSGIDFFTEENLDEHYNAIENTISLQYIEKENWNTNAKLYVEAFDKLGFKWAKLRRGQNNCKEGMDCMVCLGGCPRDSKQSTLVTFIRMAKEQGLSIEDNTEIFKIEYMKDEIKVHGVKDNKNIIFSAKKVILAGGSIGSTSILLKSGFKDKLPYLGKDFYCHPQLMNFGLFEETIDSHKGWFQGVKSDDMNMREKGYKLENVFAPPIALSILFPGMGKKHQEIMRKYRNYACIEIALRDTNPGELKLDKKGELQIDKKLSKEDWRRIKAGRDTVRSIFETMNAKEIILTDFTFGLHLMGGCVIGKNKNNSVVNKNFQVHDHPNLFVIDSSIFPNAPGVNPALTIMALAHKASEYIIGGDN